MAPSWTGNAARPPARTPACRAAANPGRDSPPSRRLPALSARPGRCPEARRRPDASGGRARSFDAARQSARPRLRARPPPPREAEERPAPGEGWARGGWGEGVGEEGRGDEGRGRKEPGRGNRRDRGEGAGGRGGGDKRAGRQGAGRAVRGRPFRHSRPSRPPDASRRARDASPFAASPSPARPRFSRRPDPDRFAFLSRASLSTLRALHVAAQRCRPPLAASRRKGKARGERGEAGGARAPPGPLPAGPPTAVPRAETGRGRSLPPRPPGARRP